MSNASRAKAVELLKKEFPEAEVGLDNFRPYAKLPDGRMFGVLFDMDAEHPRPVWAIIEFPRGRISSHNYRIHRVLASSVDGKSD